MATTQLDLFKIIWGSGFIVKSVLLLLILASILSWAIILKKRKQIKDLISADENFLKIYQQSRTLDEVMDKGLNLPFSPLKSVFLNCVSEWEKIRGSIYDSRQQDLARQHVSNFGLGSLERSIKKGINDSNLQLDSLLSTLASIGSLSPFVGLFGTVWGIINSFTGLAGGGATLDAVAPGIAEALVATAVGLAAAIPAIWFYNVFNNDNAKINTEMDSFGQDLLNKIERTLK